MVSKALREAQGVEEGMIIRVKGRHSNCEQVERGSYGLQWMDEWQDVLQDDQMDVYQKECLWNEWECMMWMIEGMEKY